MYLYNGMDFINAYFVIIWTLIHRGAMTWYFETLLLIIKLKSKQIDFLLIILY